MNRNSNRRSKESKIWLNATIGVVLILAFGYLLIQNAHQDITNNRTQVGELALALAIATLPAIGVCIFSIIKLKRWWKVVPAIGVLLLILIAALSYFIYWFSQYNNF